MKTSQSKEELIRSEANHGSYEKEERIIYAGNKFSAVKSLLTDVEKKFLLHAERGDVATVKRLLEEFKDSPDELDINCVDPLNRSALIAAIENENMDLIRVLLESNIAVKDALLHAIKEEYVEAVELLLEWEEKIHLPGQPYSWESIEQSTATFTPDITPLILAAHMNNYEILKILLDRGATLPAPHDIRCGCDHCIVSSETDSLRHSQARMNAYKALSASSLIALSSKDPLLTAFELSWELRRLSFCEAEFRAEYQEMRQAAQDFATDLLDHARTSKELEILLNYDPNGAPWEPGERQTLERLKIAIKYKQKKFVAHPNVQQLLASIWYDGLPGFRRKSMAKQILEVVKLGSLFPFYSFVYMIAPNSSMGLFMKKPFVKFIFHSSSYIVFLMLLGMSSQRVEFLLLEWFGNSWMKSILADWKKKERGSLPGLVEGAVMIYVAGWIYNEVRALWTGGLEEYIDDLWNIVDFITNCFYTIWISLRFTAIFIVTRESWAGLDPYIPREKWHTFDPMLLSEGAFAAGMIFSFLKLVHIFSLNPHLGPLQISLGRMIIDILKFFFIYTLVLFAFGCGMNQLMWYYADLEKDKCYVLPDPTIPDFDGNEKACTVWRRFANLFETSQSLFWASFGLVDLTSFDLAGIKSFTRFWALLLFGSYSVINIIVLLNMLIAMMSNSYQIISERSDIEWKFARSRLWISYFDEGDTLPAPFNLMPTMKTIMRTLLCKKKQITGSIKIKSKAKAEEEHENVMTILLRRYVTTEQRKRDEFGITEDDVAEVRQDISSLKYELIDILKNNGMKTPDAVQDQTSVSKKGRVMERRIIKDFQIGIVEGILKEGLDSVKSSSDVFDKIAKVIGRKGSRRRSRKDWNAIVRENILDANPIGSTEERNERQNARRYIIEQNEALESLDPEKLLEYNPKLSIVAPAARVAYAKFKISKIKQEFAAEGGEIGKSGNSQADVENAESDTSGEKKKEPESSIVRPRPRNSANKPDTNPEKLILPPKAKDLPSEGPSHVDGKAVHSDEKAATAEERSSSDSCPQRGADDGNNESCCAANEEIMRGEDGIQQADKIGATKFASEEENDSKADKERREMPSDAAETPEVKKGNVTKAAHVENKDMVTDADIKKEDVTNVAGAKEGVTIIAAEINQEDAEKALDVKKEEATGSSEAKNEDAATTTETKKENAATEAAKKEDSKVAEQIKNQEIDAVKQSRLPPIGKSSGKSIVSGESVTGWL